MASIQISLVNLNIAAGKSPARGIIVAQGNETSVRGSIAAVIAYADTVSDSRSVPQTRYAAQVGTASIEGECPNSRSCNGDTS